MYDSLQTYILKIRHLIQRSTPVFMSLMTLAAAALQRLFVRHALFFRWLCCSGAFLYLLALPFMSGEMSMSDQALMPDYSDGHFTSAIRKSMTEYAAKLHLAPPMPNNLTLIINSFASGPAVQALETDAETPAYIMRAERSDSVESLIIVAPQRRSLDAVPNICGVALTLAIMDAFQHFNFWSRDIVFLFPVNVDITEKWLSVHADALSSTKTKSVGEIHAGLVIELYGDDCSKPFSSPEYDFIGSDGLMPNLDYTCTVSLIEQHRAKSIAVLPRHGQVASAEPGYAADLLSTLRFMLRTFQLSLPSRMSTLGCHAPFLKRGIDVATLRVYQLEEDLAVESVNGSFVLDQYLYERVELLFRSLGNMVQHLHRTESVYVLVDSERFIAVAKMAPIVILSSVALSIDAYRRWSVLPSMRGSVRMQSSVASALAVILFAVLFVIAGCTLMGLVRYAVYASMIVAFKILLAANTLVFVFATAALPVVSACVLTLMLIRNPVVACVASLAFSLIAGIDGIAGRVAKLAIVLALMKEDIGHGMLCALQAILFLDSFIGANNMVTSQKRKVE